ncbi:hypothetical protein SADUNF_Sadunf17G0045000 [Salix dunnii]|uniref:Wall-associated receptor kinase galacturonan-binding domain-containing protein n=1 Tax=Salix dunnii TaxID=1413687 RepID=A0A835J5E7_9ROSI|nr:hypothetical protein SADUNF_Sadunf17G0045000 [Salix dunnii]
MPMYAAGSSPLLLTNNSGAGLTTESSDGPCAIAMDILLGASALECYSVLSLSELKLQEMARMLTGYDDNLSLCALISSINGSTFNMILSTHHRCSARKSGNYCAPSSCGNILNISFPFRLNTDPGSCGYRFFELACEDNVRLTLHLNMEKYYVEAINYSDSTIRLVNPAVQKDDCFSIPHHSLTDAVLSWPFVFYNTNYFRYKPLLEISVLAFICCENEIPNPPDYIMDTSSCKNSSGTAHNSSPSCVNMEGHSYVMVSGHIKDVPDLCRVSTGYFVQSRVQEDDYRANNTKLSDLPNDMDSSYQFGR